MQFNSELSKDTIAYIKEQIKSLLSKIKVDEKDLDAVLKSLEELLKLKDIVAADNVSLDLERLATINSEIEKLSQKKEALIKEIDDCKSKASKYSDELYK